MKTLLTVFAIVFALSLGAANKLDFPSDPPKKQSSKQPEYVYKFKNVDESLVVSISQTEKGLSSKNKTVKFDYMKKLSDGVNPFAAKDFISETLSKAEIRIETNWKEFSNDPILYANDKKFDAIFNSWVIAQKKLATPSKPPAEAGK